MPAVYFQKLPQTLNIADQMRRCVFTSLSQRSGAASTALVEDHDAISARVKETPVDGRGSCAGPAMEKENGLAVAPAGLFPVKLVQAINRKPAGRIGFNRRKKHQIRHGDFI